MNLKSLLCCINLAKGQRVSELLFSCMCQDISRICRDIKYQLFASQKTAGTDKETRAHNQAHPMFKHTHTDTLTLITIKTIPWA